MEKHKQALDIVFLVYKKCGGSSVLEGGFVVAPAAHLAHVRVIVVHAVVVIELEVISFSFPALSFALSIRKGQKQARREVQRYKYDKDKENGVNMNDKIWLHIVHKKRRMNKDRNSNYIELLDAGDAN